MEGTREQKLMEQEMSAIKQDLAKVKGENVVLRMDNEARKLEHIEAYKKQILAELYQRKKMTEMEEAYRKEVEALKYQLQEKDKQLLHRVSCEPQNVSLPKDGSGDVEMQEAPDNQTSNWTWSKDPGVNMANLLKTGFLADGTLLLGPKKKRVPIHKMILRAQSPVFHETFRASEVSELIIEDADPEIFHMLLTYMYTGDSGVTMAKVLPLLQVATEYKVTGLADHCDKMLAEDLSNDMVIQLFQQAKDFGREELAKSALDYICEKAWAIVETEPFLEMSHDRMLEILGRDDLKVKSEIQLFKALVKWGEAECRRKNLDPADSANVRQVLDKLVGLIRFPVMDGEEFVMNVALKNILKTDELMSISLCFIVSKENRASIPPGRFNSSKRQYYVPIEMPKARNKRKLPCAAKPAKVGKAKPNSYPFYDRRNSYDYDSYDDDNYE